MTDDLRMNVPIDRGPRVTLVVDGQPLRAYGGESIAAALIAAGRRHARLTARAGEPRGYFCGMGVCQDCLMTVDGLLNVRSCVTPVRDGLRVDTQQGLGEWGDAPTPGATA